MRKRTSISPVKAPISRLKPGKLVPGMTKIRAEKRRKRGTSASVFNKALAETEQMMASADWSTCAARHLVALYELMHRKTYGVSAEMSASARYKSAGEMGGFVKRTFDGDYEAAVDYFRWLWTREIRTEKWCRENGRERHKRLSFRLTIYGENVADYRLDMKRARQNRDRGAM